LPYPFSSPPRIEEIGSAEYYGKGYQDILTHKPSIAKARMLLGCQPKMSLDDALRLTCDAFPADWLETV
jgi:nucleoside-diphosphate-sugar epimerase